MPDLVPIRSALLSVSDKSGLVPFARALAEMGVRLISTGGTARALQDAGLSVTPVENLTGFPEGLDGRVKTLHPKVHGALLAIRDNAEHQAFCREHGIEPIDLLVINLYPFEKTVAKPGVSMEEAIENIDIGGPAMLRAAAKNHAYVAVATSPEQYDRVLAAMREHGGATPLSLRQTLALEAYAHTAAYDAAITSFLAARAGQAFPDHLRLAYAKSADLRYGENPHQKAAVYRDAAYSGPSVVGAKQLHGKELSYNNINDASAALETVVSLYHLAPDQAGACVVKHSTPCGAAIAETTREAVDRAIAGDPLAAYGGILAVNAEIDGITARRLCAEGTFLEVVVAPGFTDEAIETLRARWANLRILATGPFPAGGGAGARAVRDVRSVPGGLLVQDRDTLLPDVGSWTHAAGPAPTADQLRAAAFLEVICKSALSNAVVIGGIEPGCVRLFGVGAGQVDRLNSCRIAVAKAGEAIKPGSPGAAGIGPVAVSDAFFPFDDGPRVLIDAGVRTIVHPGGSKRDADTLKLCEERGVTCLTTGVRHFRH